MPEAEQERRKMEKTKIVIRKNGKTTYKKVADCDLLALQKEIEKNIRFHHFKVVNADEISISIGKDGPGHIIMRYKGYVNTESICNICSSDIGEELSVKEAIAYNINLLLDQLDDIVFRQGNAN